MKPICYILLIIFSPLIWIFIFLFENSPETIHNKIEDIRLDIVFMFPKIKTSLDKKKYNNIRYWYYTRNYRYKCFNSWIKHGTSYRFAYDKALRKEIYENLTKKERIKKERQRKLKRILK